MAISPTADGDQVQILLTLAVRLFQGAPVSNQYIRERFRVSRATAHRYMRRLEDALPLALEERVWREGVQPAHILTMSRDVHRQLHGSE